MRKLINRLLIFLGLRKTPKTKQRSLQILTSKAKQKTDRLTHLVNREKQLKKAMPNKYKVKKAYKKAPSLN